MADSQSPSDARSWRPFRIMAVVSLVAIVLQVVFGEVVSIVVTYPATPVPLNSVGAVISALSSAGGGVLLVHSFFGLLVFLAVLGVTISATRYHKRSVTNSSLLALVSVTIAVLGGYIWAASDFSNGGGILLMVNGALATFGLIFVALYYTK